MLARRPAREHVAPVRVEPGEERGVTDQSVFGHFGISGTELARRQGIEQRRVGEDQDRLMKCTDQVLAVAGIDCGLAADRGIDLRQQRGRHLHVIESATENGGREPGEIADDAAAQRQHEIRTLDACSNQPFAHALEHWNAFRALARRHGHGGGSDARRRKGCLRRSQMVAHDGFVGDDRNLRPGPQRRDLLAQQSQQAAADVNVVAALAERDVDDDRVAGTQGRRHGSWPPSAQATPIRPASALTISSTIFSCMTSRDCTVRSARAYTGSRSSMSLRSVEPGSAVLSQIEMPFAAIAVRVSGLVKAPPPVARTWGPPSSRRRMTRASPARNSASPRTASISLIVMPAAFSISTSASTNGMPRRSARRRPIEDLPAPIMPTSVTVRGPSAATIAASGRPATSWAAPCGMFPSPPMVAPCAGRTAFWAVCLPAQRLAVKLRRAKRSR